MKDAGLTENRVLNILMKVLSCILWCFEKCIRFLNKNAYIQIAINSEHFCVAAREAFIIILRNPIEFALVHSFGEAFMFIGKVFIASLSTLIGYIIITQADRYSEELYSPFMPCVVCFYRFPCFDSKNQSGGKV